MAETIFLSFGSNLGDREKNINDAFAALRAFIKMTKLSSLYESEPVGDTHQPWFFNCVMEAQTTLTPEQLLAFIKKIEEKAGRDTADRQSSLRPRPIDIDILFYGDEVIARPELSIPHPRLQLRRFVLVPFAEIAGDFVHPVFKKSIHELLKECPDGSIVRGPL